MGTLNECGTRYILLLVWIPSEKRRREEDRYGRKRSHREKTLNNELQAHTIDRCIWCNIYWRANPNKHHVPVRSNAPKHTLNALKIAYRVKWMQNLNTTTTSTTSIVQLNFAQYWLDRKIYLLVCILCWARARKQKRYIICRHLIVCSPLKHAKCTNTC